METTSAASQPQQPSSTAQPSSTGPQIRSRITVVCAECKRLKLKCDRRAPCGSCTKRGTVERCVYSPAAAEKVDLHSLNNRLMQVEATLALVTSGQNPPAFQSTYPLSRLSNASSSSQNQESHQHHHHYAAPTLRNTCIPLSYQDLSLWLEELDLGISMPSSSSSSYGASSSHHNISPVGTSGYIKLEPSPLEIELTHPRSTAANSIAIDADDSQTLSGDTTKSFLPLPTSPPLKHNAHPFRQQLQSQSQLQKQQRYSAQLSLPALSIYYPVPSITVLGTSPLSASAFPHHPPSSSSTLGASTSPPTPPPSAYTSSPPYTFPTHSQSPQYSKPQITPALIALLPPLPTCKRFLSCAKEILRVRPVPFEPGDGWIGFEKRCISLLGGSTLGKKERVREKAKEKDEKAKRARQIYFAGIPDLQSVQQRNDNSDDGGGGGTSDSSLGRGRVVDDVGGMGGEKFSLPFFAVICAVLAVGSHPSSNQGSIPSENPAFFFALSQQALGVWDTHTSSSGNADERERMDFLLANLIGMVYLIFSGSSGSAVGENENQEGINLAYPLVGKIVNVARGMGLGRDSPGRQSKTSDGDASASSRPRSRYHTNKGKNTEKERLWEDWKLLMWWDIMFYDLFIADSLGHQPNMPSYPYTTKLPECVSDRSIPATPTDPDNDGYETEVEDLDYSYGHDGMTMQQDGLDKNRNRLTTNSSINGVAESYEEAYVAARCRLTQLAQTIKTRMAQPECCCGYTMDQAAFLESEIRRWQLGLAPSIKPLNVSSGEDKRHPPPHCGSDLGGQRDKPPASLVSQMQSCELALIANLLMLRVHAPFLRAPSLAPTSLSQPKADSSASQLNDHAAQSTVQAAQSIIRTAIFYHAVLGSSPSPMSSPIPSMLDFYPLEKMVLNSVIICVNPALSTKSFPSSSMWTFDNNALMEDVVSGLNLLSELREMAEPHRKIVDSLYKKLSRRGTNLLKRKHDQVDMTFESPSSSTTAANGFNGGNSVTQQQQNKAIDLLSAFPSPVSSLPMSSDSLEQQQHKNNENEDLISALSTAASARLAADAAERDNEKDKDKSPKHAKKSYPAVGIRVRVAKDGSIIRPQRAQATTTGSGGQMQAPPPRPDADAVLTFQQQQKQKLQASTSTQVAHTVAGNSQQSQTSSQSSSPGMNMMQDRSRSSSFSQVQPQQLQTEDVNSQSMDLSSLPFESTPEQMDIQAIPPNIHDTNSQRQHLRHQSFGSAHMFNTQPPPLYEQTQSSFDPVTGSSGTSAEGILYNQVSSPFSNGSGAVSASSSPFTTTSSGHPSTPTFPPRQSSPPLFGPPPPTSTTSTATYYRGPSTFTSYATNSPTLQSSNLSTLQQHGNGSGMPLMDMGMDSTMMPPILETPIYDKSQQQHAMYDSKPSVVDNMSRHHHHQQQHFQQHPSYDTGSQNHRHMVPIMPPWSSPPPSQQQQQQSLMSAQNGQSFWNNGEGFKFYP